MNEEELLRKVAEWLENPAPKRPSMGQILAEAKRALEKASLVPERFLMTQDQFNDIAKWAMAEALEEDQCKGKKSCSRK